MMKLLKLFSNVRLSSVKKHRKQKTIHKAINREVLIAAVVDQIHQDIEKEETDGIRMLIEVVPSATLLLYLPDTYVTT